MFLDYNCLVDSLEEFLNLLKLDRISSSSAMAHTQTDKNEPGRFLGEGVSFRAKLIGVLEVPEARGDRMCQEALADLKMAIRAAGEHKQRIQVHVAIDGLRLRDDKTGDSLYHHPVHKISFIAQDMTDSRAFGYIFGSPDTGHRFFGIKTDKAASQVVIAMRDLFQVVFELKKKEIEMAKQQLEGKSVASSLVRHTPGVSSETKSKVLSSVGESSTSSSKPSDVGEGGVAELVDLEQELSSLRRGLTQVEGLTPSADPFGDSFIVPPAGPQKSLLPPPPSGSSTRGRNTPSAATSTSRAVFSPSKPSSTLPFDLATVAADFEPVVPSAPALQESAETTELKNPPKKVLKDLVPPLASSLLTDILQEPDYGAATTLTSLSRQSGGSVSISKQSSMYSGGFFSSDPFADADPFDSADPFSDSFKDDPFAQEFPKGAGEGRKIETAVEPAGATGMKKVFNGPLQVSLPPEPAPKSPRLQRQTTDTSSIRQRPTPSSKLNSESASPPPPLPPKKAVEVSHVSVGRPPPRPPVEHEDSGAESGPPLPPPARKKEPLADRTTKPRLSSLATNSSSDEYLAAAPPPLPAPRRFDITLSQLLTCSQQQLAERLRVPEKTLSSMTLPQLTAYLRSYLASDIDKAHIHVEPTPNPNSYRKIDTSTPPISLPSKRPVAKQDTFEDNFTAPNTNEPSDTFVANFDDFDKKSNASYDRYAAFREIQELELQNKSLEPLEDKKQNGDADKAEDEEEITSLNELVAANEEIEREIKETNPSPLKSLEELTLDSFNMFRNSVSPKPSQIDSKIEDIKNVMKNLSIEQSRRSVSPRDNGRNSTELKIENPNDRYAALREITITSPPPDEFESLPSEGPKERKRSDEKSDGFDNSDFFDCIDNSSLSFSHVDDAFRKSPVVPKDKVEKKEVERVKVEVKKLEVTPQKVVVIPKEVVIEPVRDLQPPPRLSTGSLSDVASASSPDTKDKSRREAETAGRWSVLAARASPWSSDSRDSECAAWRSPPPAPAPRPRRRHRKQRQTSSSSRDVSPWEEEPPPVTRHHRPSSHHRESRHNSSQGSRECLDSGSGRDKDKIRDKRERERDLSRDGRESVSTRESIRDRRDSGSGRDRALSKDSQRRDRRSREREPAAWDRDGSKYRVDREYRDSRSRERLPERLPGEYRGRKHHSQSWDDDDEYSDGCGSGRSSPRERWPDQRWRRDERHYGSLGWRESRRRAEIRQTEDTDRRYGATLAWANRRSAGAATAPRRDSDRRRRRDEPARHRNQTRDQRFSNEFSPRDREHASPFDNDFIDTPAPPVAAREERKKRGNYSSLEGTRFAFEPEDTTASPLSASSARARDGDSVGTRFRFDSDSVSPRSMFEDDFTTISTPRARAASIAEEDEGDLPPLRTKPVQVQKDLKKSESVNIFVRDSDPFAGDDFFACTGSDKAARRENWPGDFQAFDNV